VVDGEGVGEEALEGIVLVVEESRSTTYRSAMALQLRKRDPVRLWKSLERESKTEKR
jgi:hypothetical protein